MTSVDRLWYLADEAAQEAEQLTHRLRDRYDDPVAFDLERHVSRSRFQTIVDRIRENGLPYGAQVLVRTPADAVLLVRETHHDQWVLPGGQVQEGESIREGARRELREEAGIDVGFDGLGLLGRVEFYSEGHRTWGVLPVYEAVTERVEPSIDDPDEEILAADWFVDPPDDVRDRSILERYLRRR
ncbi:NUDIX hydrolase [Halococcoides cellulosivorans]|uniref:NUDIX hydrolase n=1 Tax=Halococcoides cellulosivorans TaxID=1679096 RepID=A0A2R4WZR0_9EURY|nr:NUDIX domain-containing protein [Halococcoides cellulosivorans]AWB27038.1 NUDIX hydrolase [Halococcoides cellulosivorans]